MEKNRETESETSYKYIVHTVIMSVPTTNRVEDMLTNGEAEVVDSVVSHIPTSVAASEPCIPAVWKNSNKQTSASDSELAKQIMARPQVSHSPYVPGQLERHLEFMHFNTSKIDNVSEPGLVEGFENFRITLAYNLTRLSLSQILKVKRY